MAEPNFKRLFFALSIDAPWPVELPEAKLIEPEARHITMGFVGKADVDRVLSLIPSLPKPKLMVAPTCSLQSFVLLPKSNKPRVVAWKLRWNTGGSAMVAYQKQLSEFLTKHELLEGRRFTTWMPHVTVGRQPFKSQEWLSTYSPLPCAVTGFHLYETLQPREYAPLWSYSMRAGIVRRGQGFIVRGMSESDFEENSRLAAAFKDPDLLGASGAGMPSLQPVFKEAGYWEASGR